MKRNSAPLISVCIPVYNTEAYLAQCLRSVIAQDFAEFEIVVVNDASCGTDERGTDPTGRGIPGEDRFAAAGDRASDGIPQRILSESGVPAAA